ncbi:MAG: polymerase subunit beta [Fusobacteriaceae bacterium]|jgi:DNA polymerase-3 subunit beta|nr:polymerase beta subunit [Fusobacteriales bacterium]MDN5304046.1 polymerase subunit beta [Fusobacteriaceae bacterium]
MLNITVNRNKFIKALKIVEKAVSENKIRPVLSGVYLEAINNKIYLKGTNLEMTISAFMFGKIFEEGAIVFSPTLIDEYLREINDEEINLYVENNILIIETEDSSSEFSLFDVSEYPKLKEFEEGKEYEVSKVLLEDMLEKSKIAAATSNDNPAINCVRLEFEEGKVKFVSSDTYRLLYLEDDLEEAYGESYKISIPLLSVEALIKTLKSVADDFVKILINENQIAFKFEKEVFQTRLVDLAFPDYANILRNINSNKEVLIDTEQFISLLKRVSVFVKNNTENKYSAIFKFKDNKLIVKGVSDIAKIIDEIDIEKEGEDLLISLNVKFLLDYLQFLDKNEKTQLKLYDSKSAVIIKSVSNPKSIYIAMPLALRD